MKIIVPPLSDGDINGLEAGDEVLIRGVIYGARDAAHKKMVAGRQNGCAWPMDLKGQIIYYVGPCPAPPGRVIGSAGPTTSGRMDSYAPIMLAEGLKGMIGKGQREPAVIEAMVKYKAVYFAAIGGAGAFIAGTIKKVETVAYQELGPEALIKMEVYDFPCIVAIDVYGNSLYKTYSKNS
ncbi:MAG: Fe-S-containing hydro-lyase [Syntrophomonadaceae bacterium]|nr:Fe-S-containing hydro-lyase [Syntrophomonadaceae bacterium]